MTLASPASIIAQALLLFKPPSTYLARKFPTRLFSKAFNSSSSCQTSVTTFEDSEAESQQKRVPLKEVVADCVGRWFKEYVKKAAEAGDPETETIVGQMICSGYGVPKDPLKGQDWINNAQWKKKALKLSRGPNHKVNLPDDMYFLN